MTKEINEQIEQLEKVFNCRCTTKVAGINQAERTSHVFEISYGTNIFKVILYYKDLCYESFLEEYSDKVYKIGIEIGKARMQEEIKELLNI